MKLATYKIKTMCDKEYTIEAITHSQAITIWKKLNTKEFFKSCSLLKSSKDVERYFELKGIERSNHEEKELQLLIDNFKQTDIFKQYKRFNCFKTVA